MKVQQEQKADRSIPRLLQLTLHEGRERPQKSVEQTSKEKDLQEILLHKQGKTANQHNPQYHKYHHHRKPQSKKEEVATSDGRPNTTAHNTGGNRGQTQQTRVTNLYAADTPTLQFRRRRV